MVNVENGVKAGEPLGGHYVLGHVDCVGIVRGIDSEGLGLLLNIEFPEEFASLVVEKGSIALDGVSLTVGRIIGKSFSVHLIPHTLKMTDLGRLRIGSGVNLEFDIIGKYISRSDRLKKGVKITEGFLREKGF